MSGSIVLHDYWRSSSAYRVRIALNLLRQREDGLLGVVDGDLEQDIGGTQGQEGLTRRECEVDRIGAVAVEDGGGLAGAAQATLTPRRRPCRPLP